MVKAEERTEAAKLKRTKMTDSNQGERSTDPCQHFAICNILLFWSYCDILYKTMIYIIKREN